jgi:hypothetical protein
MISPMSRDPHRALGAVACAAALALAVPGGAIGLARDTTTAPRHGAPVFRTAPTHAPAASRRHQACVVAGASQSPSGQHGAGLVWVRAHPTGVVAIWLPGVNANPCRARRTTSAAGLAGSIAAALRAAPAQPPGAYPCPYDDGTKVQLYFTYAQGQDEYAEVTLSGCSVVAAPQRAARWSTTRLQRQLKKAAPKAWQSYVGS